VAKKKPNTQLVFLVTTKADGSGETVSACAAKGGLTGKVTKIEYITTVSARMTTELALSTPAH